MLQSKALKGT